MMIVMRTTTDQSLRVRAARQRRAGSDPGCRAGHYTGQRRASFGAHSPHAAQELHQIPAGADAPVASPARTALRGIDEARLMTAPKAEDKRCCVRAYAWADRDHFAVCEGCEVPGKHAALQPRAMTATA